MLEGLLKTSTIRGLRFSRRMVGVGIGITVLLIASAVALVAGLLRGSDALVSAATGGLSTSAFLAFGAFILVEIVRSATPAFVRSERQKRFTEVKNRIELSMRMHFQDIPEDPDVEAAADLRLYNPSGAFATASAEERTKYRDCWHAHLVPGDGLLTYLYEPFELGSGVQPITLSVWQYGDVCRLGVFLDRHALCEDIGQEGVDALTQRCKDLFLCDQEKVDARPRHDSTLIESVYERELLLLDPMLWDEIAAQCANLVSHLSIDFFNLREERHARMQTRTIVVAPGQGIR